MCLIYAYFFKHLSLSMLVSLMLIKDCTGIEHKNESINA